MRLERPQMTTWLWIIGVTAIVWPLIVAHSLENHHFKNIEQDFINHDRTSHVWLNGNLETIRAHISETQKVIEQQDALIAALWQKTFGFYDDKSDSESELPEYLGVKPEWHPFQREWAGPVVYLVRYERYPWGTHAENLYFPD
jgi:hypothetical protein